MGEQFDYVRNYDANRQRQSENVTITIKPQNGYFNSAQSVMLNSQFKEAQTKQELRLKLIEAKLEEQARLLRMVADRVGIDSSKVLKQKYDRLFVEDMVEQGNNNNSYSKRGKREEGDQRKQEILKNFNQASKQGMSLARFCAENHFSERTVRRWITHR